MMQNDSDKRKVFQEARLRHRLELSSRQIEKVFNDHELPAVVAGGEVAEKGVRFDLQTSLAAGKEMLAGVSRDLMRVLGVSDVKLGRENGRLRLYVKKFSDVPVPLLDVLPALEEQLPMTAVIGLDEEGTPLLLDFQQEDASHVLVTGIPGAGKSSLLQSIALSLAWQTRQSQLQMIMIAPPKDMAVSAKLLPLTYLPHLLGPVLTQLEEIVETFKFLHSELHYRQTQAIQKPTIITFIDDVDVLLEMGGKPMTDLLGKLIQDGAAAGFHFVMSAENANSPHLEETMKAYLPLRIVGKAADENDALAAAGTVGTQAENLIGRGDFLVVLDDVMTYMQAAYADNFDVHMILETLQKRQKQTLVAKPIDTRISFEGSVLDEAQKVFVFNGQTLVFAPDGQPEEWM
jgi:DNA segregation ATPase FtsK/SpoIIIE-like protein